MAGLLLHSRQKNEKRSSVIYHKLLSSTIEF